MNCEAQTGDDQDEDRFEAEEQSLEDSEVIDGILCKNLFMAIPQSDKSVKIHKEQAEDENGFYKMRDGLTSVSGAGDTVAPEEEFADYPTTPSPGSKRGLHLCSRRWNQDK